MPDIWFRRLPVFDGDSFHESWNVVVSGTRISHIGPGEPETLEEPVEVTEGFLMPGFVDCHVHLGLMDPGAVLRGGVTACRDLGWVPDEIFRLARQLRDASQGPDLWAAGPMLTAPGGYPTKDGWAPRGTAREVSDADDAQKAVAEAVDAGASIIKVTQEPRGGPVLTADVLRSIVSAAGEVGLRVTSHVGARSELEKALEVGVSELAHGLWSNEPIDEDLADRLVAAGVVIVPTLHIDPTDERIENLRRFIAAGGRVVYGTDMGNSGPPSGIDFYEVALMKQAGMTLAQAFAAATSGAADHLGLGDRGRIQPGLRADLVLLATDPRDTLEAATKPRSPSDSYMRISAIQMVLKRGEVAA